MHIKAKRCQLKLKLKYMSWLINIRLQLSIDSKLTVYKTILRPIWTYGIELWGCSKPSNTKILQTFQSKVLRMISSAPWYVSNQTLHNDFEIPYVTEVIRINTNKYKNRSTVHSNQLIRTLFNLSVDRRLKQLWPEDLAQYKAPVNHRRMVPASRPFLTSTLLITLSILSSL